MVVVTLHVSDDAIPANDVADVVVRFYSEDGETFVTQAQTDEDGDLTLDLEDATTYWVRFFKIGYQFDSRLTIDVDSGETNVFDVVAVNLTVLPPSTVPYLCKASGYVAGPDLVPHEGIIFTFMLTGHPRVVAGIPMVIQDLIAVTDEDGWLEVELVRGGVYDCKVAGQEDTIYRVVVPDRTSVSVTDLVWPYVAALVYELDGTVVTSVEVASGEDVALDVYVQLSSGVITPFELDSSYGGVDTIDVAHFLTVTVTDEDILSIGLNSGVLTLTGGTPGATTITAEVKDDVEAERLPAPTRSLPTLTVTVV